MKQTESIQFLDNLGSGVDGHAIERHGPNRQPEASLQQPVTGKVDYALNEASGNQAPPSHPFSDTLTTAERMRQFEPSAAVDILNRIRNWLKDGCTISATDPNGRFLEPLPDGSWIGGLTIKGIHNTLASAISDQLVDFDIEGHGMATAWLNDREIRLEFRYWAPEEGQDTLDITGAEYGPTDGWAKVELTKEQTAQAEAALLPMYVKWLDARTEDADYEGPFTA